MQFLSDLLRSIITPIVQQAVKDGVTKGVEAALAELRSKLPQQFRGLF